MKLLAFVVVSSALAQTEPLSPWAGLTPEIERLTVRAQLPLEAQSFRPIDRGELVTWLDAAVESSPTRARLARALAWDRDMGTRRPGSLLDWRQEDHRLIISPYLHVHPILRERGRGQWGDSTRIGVRGRYYAGAAVMITGGLFLAEVTAGRAFADPLIAGTDWILHEEELTAAAHVKGLRLRIGRDRHRWGPGVSGTLLLADAGEPFNFCEYQLRLGSRLRFLALTGVTSLHQERYLAAHRLAWKITEKLSLALSEGARYQANGIHPLYLAGFVPYTLVERMDLQDNLDDETRHAQRNNVLWSVDLAYRIRPGWLLYGELLADDIAAESAEMPTRGGYQAGLTYAPRWADWDWTFGCEYTRVSNFTYSVYYQDLCACDWEHQGAPLGYGAGPDVEVLLLRAACDPTIAWGGSAHLRYQAKGEGAIGDPWLPNETSCCPSDPTCGATAEAWDLAGNVLRSWQGGLEIYWAPAALLRAGLSAQARRLRYRWLADGQRQPDMEFTAGLHLDLGLR